MVSGIYIYTHFAILILLWRSSHSFICIGSFGSIGGIAEWPRVSIAQRVGGNILVIIGMALATSNTVVRRIRECSGKDSVYAIRVGPGMRIVRRSRTKQVRVFARPHTARMY